MLLWLKPSSRPEAASTRGREVVVQPATHRMQSGLGLTAAAIRGHLTLREAIGQPMIGGASLAGTTTGGVAATTAEWSRTLVITRAARMPAPTTGAAPVEWGGGGEAGTKNVTVFSVWQDLTSVVSHYDAYQDIMFRFFFIIISFFGLKNKLQIVFFLFF